MSEQNIVVSVKNLEKSFGGRKVLEDITLDVYKGETFVIMGGSGSGKSTLICIMTGGISPEAGQVYFSDKEISRLKERLHDPHAACRRGPTPRRRPRQDRWDG